MSRTTPLLPLVIRRELKQLGADIQRCRRRRRLTAVMVAERAQISRPTLRRVERGDAAVGLGVYATVLWVLGLGDRIGSLAAVETDLIGLSMEVERLPLRVSSGSRAPRTQPSVPRGTTERKTKKAAGQEPDAEPGHE